MDTEAAGRHRRQHRGCCRRGTDRGGRRGQRAAWRCAPPSPTALMAMAMRLGSKQAALKGERRGREGRGGRGGRRGMEGRWGRTTRTGEQGAKRGRGGSSYLPTITCRACCLAETACSPSTSVATSLSCMRHVRLTCMAVRSTQAWPGGWIRRTDDGRWPSRRRTTPPCRGRMPAVPSSPLPPTPVSRRLTFGSCTTLSCVT